MDPSWELHWTFRSADVRLSTEQLANFGTADTKRTSKKCFWPLRWYFIALSLWSRMARYGKTAHWRVWVWSNDEGLWWPDTIAIWPPRSSSTPRKSPNSWCHGPYSWLLDTLHYACRYGYEKIVEYLTVELPEVVMGVDQPSLLCLTCKCGHSNIVLYLMDKWRITPEKRSEPVYNWSHIN